MSCLESGIKRKKGTLCIPFIMGGLGSPKGHFNGSLIKVKDWGTSVTRELKYLCMVGVADLLMCRQVVLRGVYC